jgi:hypothetical protein
MIRFDETADAHWNESNMVRFEALAAKTDEERMYIQG